MSDPIRVVDVSFPFLETTEFAVAVHVDGSGLADFFDEHHHGWRLAGIVQAHSMREAVRIYTASNPDVSGVMATAHPEYLDTIRERRSPN
jgi:hypothetical protein